MRKNFKIKSRITFVEIFIIFIILLIILQFPLRILYGEEIEKILKNMLGRWYYILYALLICALIALNWNRIKRIKIRKSIVIFSLIGLLLAVLLAFFSFLI